MFYMWLQCCPYNSQVMHKWCQVVSNRLPCSERVSGIGIGIDIFISNAKLGDILSYVPNITKPGQRTWSWPGSAQHWKTLHLKKCKYYKTCKDCKIQNIVKMFKLSSHH